MTTHVGIDSCVFQRLKPIQDATEGPKFVSLIGCAIITEDLDGFTQAYYAGLKNALKENKFNNRRKVLCSSEILALTSGNFVIHEKLFESILPKISKINIFFPIFNSKRIPKIKVYGKKKFGKELTFKEFYDNHLVNSFPHICLWKIFSYVHGTKSKVHIDHFQSETTEAWDIISKYPDISCYINGDMTNVLVSAADIMCRLIDNRLKDSNLFLNNENLSKILPELKKDQLFTHWIGNQHLPRITMLHTNKVLLHDYIKRPIFHIYIGKNARLDQKTIFNSIPKFLNYVHSKEGCIKFFTPSDVNTLKNGDYIVSLDKDLKKEVDILTGLWQTEMGFNVKSIDINNYK